MDEGFRRWYSPAGCPEVFKGVGVFCSKHVSLLNPRGDQALDKPLKAMIVSSFLDVFSGEVQAFLEDSF